MSSSSEPGAAAETVFRVAVDAPLRRLFDYAAPDGHPPCVGSRVRVPFGRRRSIGMVMGTAPGSEVPAERLKPIVETLDPAPLFDPGHVAFLNWSARYYHHPVGEVVAAALPGPLRRGEALPPLPLRLVATDTGNEVDLVTHARRAARQADALELIRTQGGLDEDDQLLESLGSGWRAIVRRLVDNGLLARIPIEAPATKRGTRSGPVLNAAQQASAEAIIGALGAFRPFLLNGVTGSGKTEVYLAAVEAAAARGLQSMIIVPEIGLTPQLVARFRDRLACPLAVLHSGLADGERLRAWRDARAGRARVVIGTRSAVFTPLSDLGLIIVDEEHDPSLKQQDGFRYSARDLAVVRAERSGAPVVLGTATPSLETLQNARSGRYTELRLPERPGSTRHPDVSLIDLKRHPPREGLSGPLIERMRHHLDQDGQIMVFLNRRGYAPVLFCGECGWTADCPRCDARMVYHRRVLRLKCHHCGSDAGVPEACPDCAYPLKAVGLGTERLEDALAREFPGVAVGRLDRDSTQRKDGAARVLEDVRTGVLRILVGTQMLTKGHDFPGVSLVAVLDADHGLFGTDFRSSERLAQTLTQVAGRAGRRETRGEVLIQTACPEHPLLGLLLSGGYEAFAAQALAEREAAGWPPFSHLALLRAEAADRAAPMAFLETAAGYARGSGEAVQVLGPVPATMERRAGRIRAQLLLQSSARPALHRVLGKMLAGLETERAARTVRWHLDVDPVDLL